jgi:hypothetical protein
MIDSICSKHYPKQFHEVTVDNTDGYPLYRRRQLIDNVEVTYEKLCLGVNGQYLHRFDNRDVVPYNPFLLLRYNCHINVELCSSIRLVKYLYKYVYKGHDRANVTIVDEIQTFLDCRYLCAQEACWRLFQFEMEHNHHTIYRMQLHSPDNQRVYFQEGEEAEAVEAAGEKMTMLMGWFELNSHDIEARQLLYAEVGEKYVWNKVRRTWTPRQVRIYV